MFFRWMRLAQDHLNSRMTEHRRECNQVNTGHGRARGPGVAKIIQPKAWNRALVCFCSDAVNSCKSADVRTINLNDWLVSRSAGKEKLAFDFLKPSYQNLHSPLSERHFASGRLCLSERIEDVAVLKMNILTANTADFLWSHSGFEHHGGYVSHRLRRGEQL